MKLQFLKNRALTQFQQPNGQSWVPCLKQGNLAVVVLTRGGGSKWCGGVRRFTQKNAQHALLK